MLPDFPAFKKISLEDKRNFKPFTDKFKPYCDVNFNCFWTWDTQNKRQVSVLNNNLVLYFTDYETHEPFLSFLGINKANETAETLIEYSRANGIDDTLDLVGEEVVEKLDKEKFLIENSGGAEDYVVETAIINALDDKSFKSKRNLVEKFLEFGRIEFESAPLYSKRAMRQDLLRLFDLWVGNKMSAKKNTFLPQERISIEKMLNTEVEDNDLIISIVRVNGTVVGFSLDEIIDKNYAMAHFVKADVSYKGVFEYMNQNIAKELLKRGVIHWNWGEDMGVAGLKANKLSYKPDHLLKKYKVSLK